jgi:hypothetical protein
VTWLFELRWIFLAALVSVVGWLLWLARHDESA